MEIRILGAHNLESAGTKLTSLLVDDVLALDAGSLGSSLSLPDQERVRAIFLTHYHLDHIRDVATLGLATALSAPTQVYATPPVLEALRAHLINDQLYPDLTRFPLERPSLQLHPVEPLRVVEVEGYTLLPVPTRHSVPTTGYQVTRQGKSFFYTGDTGSGLASCWQHISPELLITEVSGPNCQEDMMGRAGHLVPSRLGKELEEFRRARGYLPRVVLVHLPPRTEPEVAEEVASLARELGASISLAYEGMRLNL